MEIVDEKQVLHPDKSIYEKCFHLTKYSIRNSEPNYFCISTVKSKVDAFKRSAWSSLFLFHIDLPNGEASHSLVVEKSE